MEQQALSSKTRAGKVERGHVHRPTQAVVLAVLLGAQPAVVVRETVSRLVNRRQRNSL